LKGGLGADAIRTFGGADEVDGGFGHDVILGSEAAETLNGGHGDDTILGLTGADMIKGGYGDDVLLANGSEAASLVLAVGFPEADLSVATLNGGIGDDEMLFDSEDLAIGGPGSDVFGVEFETEGETSTGIQDFDVAEDQLVIVLPFPILAETSSVSVTNAGGTATVVVSDGATEVASVSFAPIGGDMTEELVTVTDATQVDYAAISSDLTRLPI
jgi:Ca2+-binding RTX toxin-like protein